MLLRLAQTLFGALALGNVASNPHQARNAPLGVPGGHLGAGTPADLPVGLTDLFYLADEGLAGLDDRAQDALAPFAGVEIRHIRRELNSEADALCNQTLDAAAKAKKSPPASGPSGAFRLK